MTAAELLTKLDGVRAHGTGKWSARCPAHQDNSPSLSIAEGDKGLLIHCFALCTKSDIVAAMGLTMSHLFFDVLPGNGKRPQPKATKLDRIALAWRFELASLDRRERGARIVEAAKQVIVEGLTDEELDRALALLGSSYVETERAELFESIADDLRSRDFSERKSRERRPCAA